MAIKPVAAALRALGVSFYVGGSVASSTYGVSRSTIDADIVADLKSEQAEQLCELLGDDFYSDAVAVREAVRRRESFNLIYKPRMHKVDVFAVGSLFERRMMERLRRQRVDPDDPDSELPLASPEDVILHKLGWFRMGGGTSERQWLDVLNVLKVQAGRLDEAYLDQWAEDLDLTKLLRQARSEAGQ